MHLFLVRVHVAVRLECSCAERAAIEIDSGVLSLVLDEISFVFKNFFAVLTSVSTFGVNVSNV